MFSAGIIEEHSQGNHDYMHMICLLACSSAKDKPTVVAEDTDVCQLIPPLTFLNYIGLHHVHGDLHTDHLHKNFQE